MSPDPTPSILRMPAEWEAHEATWLAWPHRVDDWPGKFPAIPLVYAEIIRHLHQSERVRLLVNDLPMRHEVELLLHSAGIDLSRIDFFIFKTDRSWTRDYGPAFAFANDDTLVILDWKFNAWSKYPNWSNDNGVAARVSAALGHSSIEPTSDGRPLVLEGGSIEIDGTGLLLTTEECLLSSVQQRNPGVSQNELEVALKKYLGVSKVLWLGRGIVGDDTHGHIDDIARFVGPAKVIAAVEEDIRDDNFEPLKDNFERLKRMKDQFNRPLEIIKLPMPSAIFFEGQRLPASYANFYVANNWVLVPTFNDPRDRKALEILAQCFPERTVVGIHSVDLVWGLGTIHCLTQQEPRLQSLKH